jgi:hypothetical protein
VSALLHEVVELNTGKRGAEAVQFAIGIQPLAKFFPCGATRKGALSFEVMGGTAKPLSMTIG